MVSQLTKLLQGLQLQILKKPMPIK